MVRVTFFILIFAVPFSATAQSVGGNPLIGRQTATTLCVPVIRSANTRGGAPSFVAVANTPSTTALSLKVFLRSNHNGMPNLIIPDSETDDLIAGYSQSQAAVRSQPTGKCYVPKSIMTMAIPQLFELPSATLSFLNVCMPRDEYERPN